MLATGLLFIFGCTANGETAIDVSLESAFQLHVGQSARISAENIEITFVGVTADSRCGKGVTCIWEGDAVVRIRAQVGAEKTEHELHTASRNANAADFANFSVGLVALYPAAIAERVIEPTAYIATLRVVRGMSGGKVVY